MRRVTPAEVAEALGALLVAVGLGLWTLWIGVVAAGLFLVAAANAAPARKRDRVAR